MIKRIIGLDPGKSTGYAEYNGEEWTVGLMDFWRVVDSVVVYNPSETAVIVELPSTKAVWHGKGQNSRAMARTGVNVGSVIREAELLVERFISLGYTVVTVHPKGKKTALYVKALTGYKGRTNEHTRDAILLAWNYRFLISKRT